MPQAKTGVCLCPNAERHPDGETLYFKDDIGFRELAAVDRAVALARQFEGIDDDAEIWARVSEFYLLHFIDSWTVTDKRGEVIPSNVMNVRELLINRHPIEALALSDFADELYSERVFVPLAARARQSPPPGLTDASASPDTSKQAAAPTGAGTLTEPTDAPLVMAGGSARGRSQRSSTITTPTGATTRTRSPRAGACNS